MRKSFGIFKGFSLNYVGFQGFARKKPSVMNLMNDKKANDFVDKFFENKENAAFTKQFDSFLAKKEAEGLNLESEFQKIMEKTKGKGGELNMNLETLFKGEDFQQLKKNFVETMSKMNKDDKDFQEMQDFIKSSSPKNEKNNEELPIVELDPIPRNQKKISDKEQKPSPKEQKSTTKEQKNSPKEQKKIIKEASKEQKTQEKSKSNEKKKKSNK